MFIEIELGGGKIFLNLSALESVIVAGDHIYIRHQGEIFHIKGKDMETIMSYVRNHLI